MEWRLILFVLPALFALSCGDVGLPGGFRDLNIDEDVGAQKALEAAVALYNKESNSDYFTNVREVKKVEVQVVTGLNYKITAIMARTSCKKDAASEMCLFSEDPGNAQTHVCTFNVWVRPWLESPPKVTQKCS
ncbi:cystatin-C-like [Halichoeres trimaculatus]|uniref:cystatin-C-like n=1 Tax=Halichoeres trimaculatus TaxID=147232 RepID=UPI003D9E00D2